MEWIEDDLFHIVDLFFEAIGVEDFRSETGDLLLVFAERREVEQVTIDYEMRKVVFLIDAQEDVKGFFVEEDGVSVREDGPSLEGSFSPILMRH